MSRNNLKYFRLKVVSIIGVFLFISIVISAILFYYVFVQNRKAGIQTFKNQVVAANNILQSSLYSQINIISNNPEFISYLFSGDLSRQRHYGDMLWLFNNLDSRLIRGAEITRYNTYTNSKQIIFSYGSKTSYYTSLEMCYLNNKLNTTMGDCVYKHFNLVIYFDPNVYLARLHQIDSRVNKPISSKHSLLFNPFSEQFAGLNAESHSQLSIAIEINLNNKFEKFLSFIAFCFFLICAAAYFISHKILSRLVDDKLVVPLKRMIDALHESKHLPRNKNNIDELNELIDIVNSYNETQLNIRLNEAYKRVIHDIRSPLFAINGSISDIFEVGNPVRKTIKDAVNNTLAILDNVLRSNFDEMNSLPDKQENKVYISIYDIMDEIVALKQVEWKKYKENFNLILNYEDVNDHWIFTYAIEFKRHMSNLLNNSFQAIKNGFINIHIKVIEKNGTLSIKIEDDGIGMDEKDIPKALSGVSLLGGNGIGLKNAKKFFAENQCFFKFYSQKNIGTTVTIGIDIVITPEWFTEVVEISKTLIVVDDDNSILQYWKNKLSTLELKILTFNSPKLFFEWFNRRELTSTYTFFIDYDYNDIVTGIDILSKIGNDYNSYLITSSYYNSHLQEQVTNAHIKMIPKSFLSEVTILLK